MQLVASTFSAREEAAFGVFLRRHFADWHCEHLPAQRPDALPAADLYLLDLAPMGLREGSAQALHTLLTLLRGKPAVLLLPAHDASWPALTTQHLPAAQQDTLVWLRKPYTTEDMRIALARVAAHATPAPPAGPPPAGPPLASPPTPARAPQPRRVPLAPRVQDTGLPGAGITLAVLQARLEALPPCAPGAFVPTLAQWLAAGEPVEVRFTLQHMLLIHPVDGWVAFNTPLAVVDRVCRSNAMASAVALRHIDTDEAEALVQRMRLTLQEMEPFLLRLFNAAYGKTG